MKQIDPKNLMTQVVQRLDAAFASVWRSKQKADHHLILINNPDDLEFQALIAS